MKRWIIFLGIFSFLFIREALCGKNVVFISEKDLPRKIGIVGPIPMSDKNIELSGLGMVKSVFKNYMAGKGYIVRNIKGDISFSKKITSDDLKKIFKDNPSLDGIVTISVYRLSSFNVAFAQYYKMDGEVCLYSKKKKLGCWRETATRKKLSIATDPLGAIATVVSSVVSSEGNVNIKNVIFDWTFKVSSLIPTFSSAVKKPKILRVVTNISKNTFKVGDKIIVGLEGSAGGKASFDIRPLIKNVPMPEIQNGIYKGMYIVKQGDKLRDGIIYVHLENERGEKRDWLESSPLVNIDGIVPSKVKGLSYDLRKDSVKLKWNTADTDVVKFEVYRSTTPLSGYKKVADVSDFFWIDKDVIGGVDYFYRVVSVDKVGNRSEPAQIGPISLPVLTTRGLPDVIVSSIAPGSYFLNSTSVVPIGSKVVFGPDVEIEFRGNSTLKIEGQLTLNSVFIHSDKSNSTKVIYVGETGKLNISNNKIYGIDRIYVEGNLRLENSYVKQGHDGLLIESIDNIEVTNSTFIGLNRAIVLENGKLYLVGCNFDKNKIALFIKKGIVNVVNNNFMDNEVNIESKIPLRLKTNFLGGDTPDNFRIRGKVKVISFLSSPYPSGKEVFLKDLIEEAKKKEYKAISYINKGDYKKAVSLFKEAIPVYSDVSSYIYYIYALSMTKDPEIENVIETALKKYPEETRIYQIGIRYFLQINKIDKAKQLLQRGLKLNPDSTTLKSMEVFFN